MKKYHSVVLAMLLAGLSQTSSATSFYFAAHADDIELFMARNVAYDVKSGAKVVFVLTTTGSFIRDSVTGQVVVQGAGVYPGLTPPSNTPYYLTREAGHAAALQSWYKLQNKPLGANSVTSKTFNGKQIARTAIGGPSSNVVMYNLRLVDGDEQSQQGLQQFRLKSLSNPTTRIASVDGKLSFTWDELKSFVIELIKDEQDGSDSWVNIPEYWEDGTSQPYYDHLDHIETGRLVSHAIQGYTPPRGAPSINTVQWLGYHPSQKPCAVNYTAEEKAIQQKIWNDLNSAKVAAGGPDTRDQGHAAFLYRIYQSPHTGPSSGPDFCE